MKVCAVSDLHGFYPKIPPCELLLIAGDLLGPSEMFMQIKMVNGPFVRWLKEIPAEKIIMVAGNHDIIFQERPDLLPQWPENVVYLQDSEYMYNNWKIYGSPWQRRFCDWAFNEDEENLASIWAKIPDDTDILITHSPPWGWGDADRAGQQLGSPSLTRRVLDVKPELHVYGHIHDGYGIYFPTAETIMANVSVCTNAYKPTNPVMEFIL